MNRADVRVFGLKSPRHTIEDIRMDVPYGREIIIPGEKAALSKDLYRAINQGILFQLVDQPSAVHMAPPTHIRDDVLQERLAFLEKRCKHLEEQNKTLQEALTVAMCHQERLDTILAAVQGIKIPETFHGIPNGKGSIVPPPVMDEIADGTAPTFIPSEIAPKNAETRIDIRRETADSGVSNAADRLRKMRQGGPSS